MEHAVNKEETNLTTINGNVVREDLQVVPATMHGNAGINENTLFLCYTGSSHTSVDQELFEKLKLDGEEVTIHVAGIHCNSRIQSKKVEIALGLADSTAANKCTIMVNSHKNLAVGERIILETTEAKKLISPKHTSEHVTLVWG